MSTWQDRSHDLVRPKGIPLREHALFMGHTKRQAAILVISKELGSPRYISPKVDRVVKISLDKGFTAGERGQAPRQRSA